MQMVISKDGTKIAFDKVGTGPALILIGGAFQYRAIDPRTTHLAELLANNFTVYNYDRRGRGDSTDNQPYSVQREIEDINAIIEHSGGEAFVFGMSSGGVLALKAAASNSYIKKIVIYEPPFRGPDSPKLIDNFLSHLKDFIDAGDYSGAVEYFLVNSAGVPEQFIDGMRKSPIWGGFVVVAPTLIYDATIMGDCNIPAGAFSLINQPVLIVDGENSPNYWHKAMLSLKEVLPNCSLRTLKGQDHNVSPDVLAPIMMDFYNS